MRIGLLEFEQLKPVHCNSHHDYTHQTCMGWAWNCRISKVSRIIKHLPLVSFRKVICANTKKVRRWIWFFGGDVSLNFWKLSDQNMQWNIDFYPRGIKYSKAQMINVYNSAVEVPEAILRTIRLSVTCKRDLTTEQRFKVNSKRSLLNFSVNCKSFHMIPGWCADNGCTK